MRKLPMSAEEIAASYRTAKNRRMQIGVLADLNLCSKAEMRQVLEELGVLEKQESAAHRGGRPPIRFDEKRAQALWDGGANDIIGTEENMTVTLEGEPLRDETVSRP